MADATTTVKAVRIHAYGGPEALVLEDVPLSPPGPGEARVRHRAIGLNFADLHNRTGRYPVPALPHVLGGEGAGVVEAVGPGVTAVEVGERVCYTAAGPGIAPGAYAEARNVPAERLVPLPDAIDDETAAALFTKGLTAQYLLKGSFPVSAGEWVVIHAAAGGVGKIMTRWARHLGCRVVGVVGSPEKAAAAAPACHHVVVAQDGTFWREVRRLTAGAGVPVVYDSVGRDTFEGSLRCLSPNGTLVCFGTASGPIPPVDPFLLNRMGSLHLTFAGIAWFTRDRRELLERAADLFGVLLTGAVEVQVAHRYALAEAADAHRDLEARRLAGPAVLLP